jgi:hypothetical protein
MNMNKMNKQTVNFGNNKIPQITNKNLKYKIIELISSIGTFNIKGKYYNILNKKTINYLKSHKSYISLRTYGKSHILFLTKIKSNKTGNDKKYCIFINKKNEIMFLSKFKLNEDLFNGTLFDGELVKNSNGEWNYFIDDIAYYKGESIIMEKFKDRYNLIQSILKEEYIEDNDLSICSLQYKKYYELNNIQYLYDLQQNELDYKCSGIYFKNNNNFSDNYLYPFPECRSDYKVNQMKNNGLLSISTNEQVIHNTSLIDNISPLSDQSNDEKVLKDNSSNSNSDMIIKNTNVQIVSSNKCSFEIRITNLPDIYELYAYNNSGTLEKISYASIQDLNTSNFCKELLKGKEKENVLCLYNKNFKKWKPIEKSNKIDNIQTINIIQNI